MKSYPSIPTKINFKHEYIVFDKLDGSNIRVEWSEKNGFYKFGSRKQLLSEQQAMLYPAIEIVKTNTKKQSMRLLEQLKPRAECAFLNILDRILLQEGIPIQLKRWI